MQELIKKFEKNQIKRKMPEIKPGDTVKVHQKIKEGDKERIQFFQGVVIRVSNGYGLNGTFTIRKIASGVGVEKIFPFHLPTIVKLEVLKRGNVRRAKLYYLRKLEQKKAKLKEKNISQEDLDKMGFDEVKEKEVIRVKQEAEAKKKAEASVEAEKKVAASAEATAAREVKKDEKTVVKEAPKTDEKTKEIEKKPEAIKK